METTSVADREQTPDSRSAMNIWSVLAIVTFLSFAAWAVLSGEGALATTRDWGALLVLVLGVVLILGRRPGPLTPASPTQFLGIGLLVGLSISSIGADGPWFMLATPLAVAFVFGHLMERFGQRFLVDHSAGFAD